MSEHLQDMRKEQERFDKLGTAFLHFNYRKRYGWTFEQFVRYVDNGTLAQIVGE